MLNSEQVYKLTSVSFLIAGIAFLISGVLGSNSTVFFVLGVTFIVNSILFTSLSKRKSAEKIEI